MQDDLSRAQHYRLLEKQMREAAAKEDDLKRRIDLGKLADHYSRLADGIVARQQKKRS